MILREIRSDSIICLPRVTFCDKNRILDTMYFTCICQCFADMFTLLETQLQESSGLDQFHMTSKAQIVKSLCLPFFPYIRMHAAHTYLVLPTNILYLTLSQSQVRKESLLVFGKI